MNKAILVGRLTKEPELRTSASGTSICSFTVAVPRRYVKQGEERQTDFINCVAFNKTAEWIEKWFGKGSMISIDGTIQTRSWDDGNGKKHYATEVIVNEAGFVGGSNKKDETEPTDELPELPSEFNPEKGIFEYGTIPPDDGLPF